MALKRGNKRYGDVVDQDEYIKSLQQQKQDEMDTNEVVDQIYRQIARSNQPSNTIKGYFANGGTDKTLETYIRGTLQQPQVTNTSNPVPTVPTVQQEQRTVLDEQKNMADAAANASYQRMLKYLPQINKDRGYAGLGISEATKAQAWNDYQTRLAQLAMSYAAADEQKSEASNQNALNAAYSELQEATSAEDAQDILNRYRQFLSPSDAALLETMSNSNSQKAMYQAYADQAAGYNGSVGATFDSNGQNKGLNAGDNFRIKGPDGTIYYIESGGKVNDADIVNAATRHNDGDVFKYGNNLYMVKNGAVYLVQRRKNSEAKSYQALLSLYSGM